MDISFLSKILSNLLNSDKNIRESGEFELNQLIKESPSKLLLLFIGLLKERESDSIKELIAILLRQYLSQF